MYSQEKSNLKTIGDMIENCHPNVILVEKSVSRDIQESILAKGMTLVFDMKLHRLDRVARCIGSPISSTELSFGQKLRQCESFYIEKFVEEHDFSNDGGKKPSKTLMFLEGCPSRLGCTVSLPSRMNCLFPTTYFGYKICKGEKFGNQISTFHYVCL